LHAEDVLSIDIINDLVHIQCTLNDAKKVATWGTYGPKGKGPLKIKKLKNLKTDHLQAILRTQHHIKSDYVRIIQSILDDRGEPYGLEQYDTVAVVGVGTPS
jgi:hypothetical protein